MSARVALLTLIVSSLPAVGQDRPQGEPPLNSPSLDTERWLRGKRTQNDPRKFAITPELRVTPGTPGEAVQGNCSIRLLEFRPESNARMKILPPKTEGHIRFLNPPAPPCPPVERSKVSPKPTENPEKDVK